MTDKLKIGIVGDIIAADSPIMSGQGVYSSCKGDYDILFSFFHEYSKSFDFLVGNFESVLVEKIMKSSPATSAMKSPLTLSSILSQCKFKYLSIANNHTMEYGPDSFSWMCEKFNSIGISTFGHKSRPFVVFNDMDRNIKICLFAFSTVPAMYGFEPEYYFLNINEPGEEEYFLKSIKEAKRHSDYLLVFPHWGYEFMERPAPWQFKLAEKIVQSGADAILGTHSHVIQSPCLINNIPVFFSMGNFLSDYFQKRFKRSLFVKISCDKISLGVSNRIFSYDEKFVIYATEDKVKFIDTPKVQEAEDQYANDVNITRKKVRRQLVFHLLKHPSRWVFNKGFWFWLIKRAVFLLLFQRKIKNNPDTIYSGPIH